MKRTPLFKKLRLISYYAHIVISANIAAFAGFDMWIALYLHDRPVFWYLIVIVLEIAYFAFGYKNIRKVQFFNAIRRAKR